MRVKRVKQHVVVIHASSMAGTTMKWGIFTTPLVQAAELIRPWEVANKMVLDRLGQGTRLNLPHGWLI